MVARLTSMRYYLQHDMVLKVARAGVNTLDCRGLNPAIPATPTFLDNNLFARQAIDRVQALQHLANGGAAVMFRDPERRAGAGRVVRGRAVYFGARGLTLRGGRTGFSGDCSISSLIAMARESRTNCATAS